MSLFRALPPARCLELIHAWTNAPWPLTWDQAFAIAHALGWKQDPNEPRYYRSDLADDDIDCGMRCFRQFPQGVRPKVKSCGVVSLVVSVVGGG